MQCYLALLGDAVSNDALELRGEGEHGAEDFADGREIVVGDPAAKSQQLIIEDWRWIDDAEDILRRDGRLAVVKIDYDAHHALLAEGDENAPADYRRHFTGDAVGEYHVQRHGKRDVAEFGHWMEG